MVAFCGPRKRQRDDIDFDVFTRRPNSSPCCGEVSDVKPW
jgi:hypothetical protein